jgi:hypothetical protein
VSVPLRVDAPAALDRATEDELLSRLRGLRHGAQRVVLQKLLAGGMLRDDPSALRELDDIQKASQPSATFRMKARAVGHTCAWHGARLSPRAHMCCPPRGHVARRLRQPSAAAWPARRSGGPVSWCICRAPGLRSGVRTPHMPCPAPHPLPSRFTPPPAHRRWWT